ncbi:MAG: hypothetical protein ABA06_00695 [Parcubacteria bacterium C7867-001]|nr:MAG: hypothetical protein ABA06_00695 [Parcubacteria bacterium C7867-001]
MNKRTRRAPEDELLDDEPREAPKEDKDDEKKESDGTEGDMVDEFDPMEDRVTTSYPTEE